MLDLASISAALSSVKTATDLASIIKQSGVSLKNAEIQLQTAELISALAEVKMQLAEVRDVIAERDQTIRDLNARLELKGQMTFKAPFYYMEGDPVPYCPRCWESERKAIHLHDCGVWRCEECNKCFGPRRKAAVSAGVLLPNYRNGSWAG